MFDRLSGHFKTITHHKALVTKTCFRVGLYRQGLLHDLSKYNPVEFLPGVKYYQGNRSPISAEKEEKNISEGWLHHKGKNPHHFEYWIDYGIVRTDSPEGKKKITFQLMGMKMSKRYVAEMVIDRLCASKNYQKEKYTDAHPLEYFMKGSQAMLMHPETEYLTRYLLTMLADRGEEELLSYMKNRLLKNRNGDYHVREGRLYLD